MKSLAGLCLVLAAGCSTLPVARDQRPESDDLTYPPVSSAPVRIGVEYLPPDPGRHATPSFRSWPTVDAANSAETHSTGAHDRAAWSPVDMTWSAIGARDEIFGQSTPSTARQGFSAQPGMTVSQRHREPPPPVEPDPDFTNQQIRWHLSREGIRAVESPLERVALRFLSELIGDDHKRVTRAIGAPLLRSQIRLSTDPMSNYLDERDLMDHQRRLTENGTRMIRRPLRNAMKELPIFNDVELAIHSIKSAHVVTRTQRNRRPFGRVSVKLRAGRLDDPVELTWIKKGIRISSSQDYLKSSFTTELLPDLHMRVRTRYDYRDYNLRLLGQLVYEVNDRTTVQAVAGNLINVSAGLSPYPGGPRDDERGKGVFVLVEHHF